MASLKSFLPHMAKVVGTTADALYSRQRALVDLGVLETVKGRGPGSGTPLSANGVSAMIIALMTADSLQDTDDRVASMCRAVPERSKACPFTKKDTLQDALAAVLESRQLINSFFSFSLSRPFMAQIGYGRPNKALASVFHAMPMQRRGVGAIQLIARIDTQSVRALSAMLQAEMI
jgi:hypothetical protein